MITVYFSEIRQVDSYIMKQFPQERRERIQKIAGEEDRKRSYTGTWLLLKAFWDMRGAEEALPAISYQEGGKPYSETYPEFCFSISHSGDYAVCAVTKQKIGVDIQRVETVRDSFAERFFTGEENLLLREQPEEKRQEMFFRIWTAKEAYIKYTGNGMRQDMRSFTVNPETGEIRAGQERFFLTEHRIQKEQQNYAIGICTKEQETEIIIRT